MKAVFTRLPVRRVFNVVSGSTPDSDNANWEGDVVWVTPEDLGRVEVRVVRDSRRKLTKAGLRSCATSVVPAGSVVLSTRAPIGHVALAGVPLCTNQGCKSLVARGDADSRFFYYQMVARRSELQALGSGSTFMELSADRLASVVLAVPPLWAQRAIADFLDRKTAAINELIRKKERLIELLEEKRQALITQAVTKGLDPNVPMKDSGVVYFGAIPNHWQVKRLKYVSPRVTVGIVVTPAKYYVEEGLPCPRSLNVRPGRLLREPMVYISAEANELHAKSRIFRGDLVSVRTGQPGTTAVVDDYFDGSNCIDLIVVRRSSMTLSDYLCYLMNSDLAHRQYGEGAEGALQQHFNVETAGNLLLPCPPLDEQEKILGYLVEVDRRLSTAAASLGAQIEALGEYRQALITAAVTGQLDIPAEPAA